jgi:hypothetical protein
VRRAPRAPARASQKIKNKHCHKDCSWQSVIIRCHLQCIFCGVVSNPFQFHSTPTPRTLVTGTTMCVALFGTGWVRKLTHRTAYTPIHIGVADSQTTLIVDVVSLEFRQVSCYESFPTQHSKVLLSVAKFVLICQLFKMCTNFIQFLDHNCNVSPRILIARTC